MLRVRQCIRAIFTREICVTRTHRSYSNSADGVKRRPVVAVGMSGGVDSSVAALLLQRQVRDLLSIGFGLQTRVCFVCSAGVIPSPKPQKQVQFVCGGRILLLQLS